MTTTKPKAQPGDAPRPQDARGKERSPQPDPSAPVRPSGSRETIECIVVAFVLAFLFKTFEAEAFVIPTGSMAPTLYGRNKDLVCPKCGTHFTIGASDEVENETDYVIPDMRIDSATCPNCRYRLVKDEVYGMPVFKGDRILVTKFSYELADPKRFDVVVFKYPEDPKTNYIKRCIGLPNETIEIRQGDVYRLTPAGVEILRKDDPRKQRMLQIPVYDNDHPERPLLELGWPERWAAVKKIPPKGAAPPDAIAGWSADLEGWVADAEARTFHLSKERAGNQARWIRYRNFVPDRNAWRDAEDGRRPGPPKPQLITDFCGYNAFANPRMANDEPGQYWVGDLTVRCQIDVQAAQPGAQVVLELTEGSRVYRCRIDVASGKASLSYAEPHDVNDPGDEHPLASAETRFQGTGSHRVEFANADDRLCLWIDDRLIDFGEGANYTPYGGVLIQRPWDEDLIPVGIAAQGADVTVSHLVLKRDIYYRADFILTSQAQLQDALPQGVEESGPRDELIDALTQPAEWFRIYERGLASRQTSANGQSLACRFAMAGDEFFMMGDNSPRSKDSRLWENRRHALHSYAVPRIALVGKAFFVYWPHGIPFLNDGRGYPDGKDSIFDTPPIDRLFYHMTRDPNGGVVVDQDYPKLRIPFYPDFSRMHRIR